MLPRQLIERVADFARLFKHWSARFFGVMLFTAGGIYDHAVVGDANFRLEFGCCEWGGSEVEIGQSAHHFGMHELGLRAWLCAGVRERKFGKRSQPGFTTVDDVRNRRGTRMLVAE
jgi:hypothetical protein